MPRAQDLIGCFFCEECGYGGFESAQIAHRLDEELKQRDITIQQLHHALDTIAEIVEEGCPTIAEDKWMKIGDILEETCKT